MRSRLVLAGLCALALALSFAYVHFYLRGGPRIIDATSYWLEAKSLAAGSFTFPASEPRASFAGRFLLPTPDGARLGVIFPPGYPLVLSLGMLLGAPLALGPALAALLVAATYALARALGQDTRTALVAAGLSTVCAALRYHTADTMSHGLATLLGTLSLTFALTRPSRLALLGSGICLGLLAATRPVSAAVALLLVLVALRSWPRRWLWLALGAVPGTLLLLFQQRALTGSFFSSVQLAYYAASDSSPDCFRYGFGAGIGCRYEHGDYVTRFLPDGYGAREALRNLLARMAAFSTDVTNAAPLTLLAVYAVARHRRTPLVLLGVGVALQALAYVPFYFDGNYEGGGARFLCEAIPLCQILVARAACDLRLGAFLVPAALAGFLLHGRLGHEHLRDREGGRPMFEPSVLAESGVERGLVFVDTDHGFNLGHDPSAQDPRLGLVVARARNDGHDQELASRLGSPPTYRYLFDPQGRLASRIEPYSPPASARFESEAEWPVGPERGSAYPIHYPCASAGRALRLKAGTRAILPIPSASGRIHLGWVTTSAAPARLLIYRDEEGPQGVVAEATGCSSWVLPGPAPERRGGIEIELVSGEGAVDFLARLP